MVVLVIGTKKQNAPKPKPKQKSSVEKMEVEIGAINWDQGAQSILGQVY